MKFADLSDLFVRFCVLNLSHFPFLRFQAHVLDSESVMSAVVANPNVTFTTLVDETAQVAVALLAMIRTFDVSPANMIAIMVYPELLDFLLDPSRARLVSFGWLTVDILCGTSEQSILVPLRAAAGSPAGSTEVAELGPAAATARS